MSDSRADLELGLRYTHLVGEGLLHSLAQGYRDLYGLLDVLVRKGVVSFTDLEEAKRGCERAVRDVLARVPSVQLAPPVDKYQVGVGAAVPCVSRLALCRSVCCRLVFPLSVQDLEEGVVRWDYLHPYLNARRTSGFCAHRDDHGECTIYTQRPASCRAFDCRSDPRIWSDYENSVLAPEAVAALAALTDVVT